MIKIVPKYRSLRALTCVSMDGRMLNGGRKTPERHVDYEMLFFLWVGVGTWEDGDKVKNSCLCVCVQNDQRRRRHMMFLWFLPF